MDNITAKVNVDDKIADHESIDESIKVRHECYAPKNKECYRIGLEANWDYR